MSARPAARIGVAGWSYPDWRGIVYPRGCRDPLRFVASRVDLIEVNASFYRVPAAGAVAGWRDRTADLGTMFTAKLPRSITHDGDHPAGVAAGFLRAFGPLVDSGRMAAWLAQFSHRFEAVDESFHRLAAIAAAFGGAVPLALEVRHRSWRSRAAQDRAQELGFAPVHLDYAASASGFVGPAGPVTPAYLRLHGRSPAWFDASAGRDATYDYEYSAAELATIVERVTAIAGAVQRPALVVANNHYRGKAVKLALELLAWRDGGPVDVPADLLRHYPALRPIAARVQNELF